MRNSYIQARAKHLLSPEIKLVFFFFGVSIFLIFSTYLFLLYKTYDYRNATAEIEKLQSELNISIATMNEQIDFISIESQHSEQVFTSNTILKESITNLFDLIPEHITLSKAFLDSNALILYGVTPTKEVYEFMLHAPLRSIFHRTYSSFYPLDNGWYRFVSTNYLDDESEAMK